MENLTNKFFDDAIPPFPKEYNYQTITYTYPKDFKLPDLISASAASKIAEEAFKSRAYYLKKIKGLEKNLYNMRKDARRRQATIWKRNQQIAKFESFRKQQKYSLALQYEQQITELKEQLEKEKTLRLRQQAFSNFSLTDFFLGAIIFLVIGALVATLIIANLGWFTN